MFINLLENLGAELGHRGHSCSRLDLINSPKAPDGEITKNRRRVFKLFNYRFEH